MKSGQAQEQTKRQSITSFTNQVAASQIGTKHLGKRDKRDKVNTLKIRHIDCQTDFPAPEPVKQVVERVIYVPVDKTDGKQQQQPAPKEF